MDVKESHSKPRSNMATILNNQLRKREQKTVMDM